MVAWMLTVADLVVRKLSDAGVRTLFGVPGGGGTWISSMRPAAHDCHSFSHLRKRPPRLRRWRRPKSPDGSARA